MAFKVNYTAVGVFVFIFFFLVAGFVFWMGKYGVDVKKFEHYKVLMKGSVSGLNVESPVKFRGVSVGTVKEISINEENSEEIIVNIAIKQHTPIKEDSVAVLTAQGITGLSYIELEGGSKNSPRLRSGQTIPSGDSLFSKIEYSATSMSDKIVGTLQRVDALLSETNLRSVEQILSNIEKMSEHVPTVLNQKNIDNIGHILENMEQLTRLIATKKETIGSLLDQGVVLEKSLQHSAVMATQTLETTNKLLVLVSKKIENGEFDLKQNTEVQLETLTTLLRELQQLSQQSHDMINHLKNSPSDLLFQHRQRHYGPGEK
jgi:phospholipid/cholesterol/gamma-HCH transport system substrate-binding protein